jgi:hypothetical protein
MGPQQKIDSVACFVDGTVQILPFALNLEWSKRQGVVELSPCLCSPNRTGVFRRIRLSIQVLLIAKTTSDARGSEDLTDTRYTSAHKAESLPEDNASASRLSPPLDSTSASSLSTPRCQCKE